MTTNVDFENRVLETLNAGKSVEAFLANTVSFIIEVTNTLFSKIFRKDDYAVKYAVDPLLTGNGPLSELGIKLKLLYALGIIQRHEYEDAEYLLALYDEVIQKSTEVPFDGTSTHHYQFTDEEVIAICYQLNCVEIKPVLFDITETNTNGQSDPNFLLLQQKRNRQVIKSTLVLSVTSLINRLYKKPAEKISPLA